MRTFVVFAFCFLVFTLKGQTTSIQNTSDLIPDGFRVFEKVAGDLNKDEIADTVYIIKAQDSVNIVINRFDAEVDRNRRGLIVLLSKDDGFDLVLKNQSCFTSENEDGGVYFPPELFIDIKKGNLYIQYKHGRYGYWQYTFRFQQSFFELIGYDASEGGAVINRETSINFSTKRKQTKLNTNQDAEGGDEIFEVIWEKIEVDSLIKLLEIEDFSELDMSIY